MIDNSIKLLVVPPGGWSFSQPIEGGDPFLITAQTYPQLENRVVDFRIQHLEVVPGGSAERSRVREDIRLFICSRYPEQCVGNWTIPERDHPSKNHATGYVAPIQRLDDWFKTLSVNSLDWKDASRALAAADVCRACPQNIGWKTDCKPCGEAIEKRIYRYKGDRQTPMDNQLKACRIYGHHNELAIWLKNTHSVARTDVDQQVPEECWNQ